MVEVEPLYVLASYWNIARCLASLDIWYLAPIYVGGYKWSFDPFSLQDVSCPLAYDFAVSRWILTL